MEKPVLDNDLFANNEISEALYAAGVRRFYKLSNGKYIVEETDIIQVTVDYVDGQLVVKEKFPILGNPAQILMTILLLVIWLYMGWRFPWIVAILGGWGFSYAMYLPKIRKLKHVVELALMKG